MHFDQSQERKGIQYFEKKKLAYLHILHEISSNQQ